MRVRVRSPNGKKTVDSVPLGRGTTTIHLGRSPQCDGGELDVTAEQFNHKWTALREQFARFCSVVSGVAVCDELLADVLAMTTAMGERQLTPRQASNYSGWSKRTIERWIRDGRIENVGRRGRPAVRLCDLPKKIPEPVESRESATYDVSADARTLARQFSGGQYGSKAAA
jgi:hypothetical protein